MTDSALPHVQRAQMFLQTDRFNEAEKELRTALTHSPEYAYAHALLSVCLSRRLKHEAAFEEAKMAIAINPDEAVFYYFYAESLLRAKRWVEARQTIEHAISLDPDDADYYYLRAAIELEKNEHKTARDTLKHALEIDPEHENSLSLLARVQAVLGETDDAEQLARVAVRNRPESAEAHVSRGYSLLYAGRAGESFNAFREALRLDPNSEPARAGLIEALKIHNIFYRLLFQLFVTMSRLSAQYQWAMIIGLIVGYNFLRGLLKQIPALAPVIVPLLVLYVLFCFVTWVANPIIYTTLWFSRWGRLAMTLREKMVGLTTVLLGTGSVTCIAAFFVIGHDILIAPALGCLFLLLPVTRAVNSDHREDFVLSAVISTLIIALTATSIVMRQPQYLGYAGFAFVAYLFLANFMSIRRSAPQD
jgi:Tfp pilus assembly protein PilF/energy-converting hydrogenase Eha subunit A